MPCYRPLTAWYSRTVNPSGKRSLVFTERDALPLSKMEVACGQCVGCKLQRAGMWAARIYHESHEYDLSVFLTLTYSNLHIPQDGSLNHRHFQLFMKRLRKYHHYANPDAPKIKYYMCGEYGGNTDRPHYHAIVFGLDFADKRKHSKGKRGDQIYVSDKLNELWGMGYCWIGSVSHRSAGYCARYCLKKITGEMAVDHYKKVNPLTGEIFEITPEYLAVSNGVGFRHFEKHHEQMYLRDSCVIEGKQTPVPKYYDRKLEQINPQRLEEVKKARKKRALKRKQDSTPERLRVREECKIAQIKSLRRELE